MMRKALMAFTTAIALPLAAGMTLASRDAAAQPVTGLYVGAGAGWNWLQDSDVDLKGVSAGTLAAAIPGATPSGSIEFEDGWAGVLSVGWGFGNGLRAEIEGNFRENSVDSLSGFGTTLGGFGGKSRTWGAMVNVLYDFYVGTDIVYPYIGVGAGWAQVQYDGVRARGAGGGQILLDDEDSQFAYQGIVGASFPIRPVPGLSITAEYRFFGTTQAEIAGRVIQPNGAAARAAVEVDNFNHSVMGGIRYAFYQPRPAPPPAPVAPAAPPPSTFLVFFDWDRADLTARARDIITQAAQASRTQQVTRLDVAGHADRSGSPQYNQRLSQRRADNVAAELVRQGVPRTAIVVSAYGETRPLVPTADGVREPQNRRVEIVLR